MEHTEHDRGAALGSTRWSIVALAAQAPSDQASRQALAELCQAYWTPLYGFARRRLAKPQDAQDAVQDFFTWLLEQNVVAAADPTRGRFRSFLLTCFERFLANQHRRQQAIKRGGGKRVLSLDWEAAEHALELASPKDESPQRCFQRQWALTVTRRVLEQLRSQQVEQGRGAWFDALAPHLTGAAEHQLKETAQRLGVQPTTVRAALHRLRRRYGALLRTEIAHTVSTREEVDQEIQALLEALAE